MIRTSSLAATLSALLALAACGGTEGVDRHVEDLVTIQAGLYGQATYVDDVGPPAPVYLPGLQVQVFALPEGTTLGAPIGSTTSGQRGFYQLALPAGDYVVCTAFGRCVRIALSAELLRLDYEMSLGPGWMGGVAWP